jgi:hypothetical protein
MTHPDRIRLGRAVRTLWALGIMAFGAEGWRQQQKLRQRVTTPPAGAQTVVPDRGEQARSSETLGELTTPPTVSLTRGVHDAEEHAQLSDARTRTLTPRVVNTRARDKAAGTARIPSPPGSVVPAADVIDRAARICVLEAEWRKTDCTAILMSASLRSRSAIGSTSWLRALERYSAGAWHKHKRRVMLAIARNQKRWTMARAHVANVLNGDVVNPCRGAVHFGSPEDGSRGRMVQVRCTAPTVNRYYRIDRHPV